MPVMTARFAIKGVR